MTIKVTYNVTDVYVTQDVSPVYINVSYSTGSSGGSAVWGGITGTLSDQTDLQSALDLKVPYTGATTNVNLGEYEIKAGQVTLDTSPTGTAAVGTTRWNDTTGSSETTLKGGSVILKNGVDLVARVVNKVSPNTTLTKAAYQAVRVSGAQGQRLAVAFAQANNDNNSADTIGLVTETIATNQEGFIITVGQLENINTTGSLQGETWVDGDVLYLSPTTAGALTNIKPNATVGHIVVIGYVEYAHAVNGKIYVKVMNGWELGELHDVYVPTPSNNDVLTYETSSGLWKNKSVGTALGYTPANSATTLTINGVTYDLSANRTFSVGSVTGSGASGQVAYWTGTSAQSGSNNLFWDSANGRLGIRTATPGAAVDVWNVDTTENAQYRISDSRVAIPDYSATGFSPNLSINTLGFYAPWSSITGGLQFAGFTTTTNSGTPFAFIGNHGGTSPTTAAIRFIGFKHNGSTNRTALTGSEIIAGFSAGFNADVFQVRANGNTLINSTTDGGQRLQVQGTTLLNGNVTFSSATGMFWDATNSRLGIGTNTPSYPLHIRTSSRFGFAYECTDDTANQNYLFLYRNSATPTANDGIGTVLLEGNNSSLVRSTYAYFGGRIISSAAASHSGELYFATTNGGTEADKLVIKPTGNVLIQNGGTFTDSGERLQVTGTMKVTGYALFGSGNSGTPLATLADFRGGSDADFIQVARASTSSDRYVRMYANGQIDALSTKTDSPPFTFSAAANANTSGARGLFSLTNTFNPTSGTATYTTFAINQTINQVGATGITRGLYVNPTLTSAADFRAIETTNGKVIFGNLPTSSAGLPTGAIWNDAGTLKIV